jgi:hypothetical protein
MQLLLNASSVIWFLVAFGLAMGVIFSPRIKTEVGHKNFVFHMLFSLIAATISFFREAEIGLWLYGASLICFFVVIAIAGRHRARIMSAFR